MFDMAVAGELSESVQNTEPNFVLIVLSFGDFGHVVQVLLDIVELMLSSQEHCIDCGELTNREVFEAFEGLLVASLAVRIVQTLFVLR